MSRETARAAIVNYCDGRVPGITTWCRTHRETLSGNQLVDEGQRFGAIAIVNLPSKREYRIALGGEHYGVKRIDRDVEVELMFRYTAGDADVGQDRFEAAENALDDIVDNLEAWLRADRTLDTLDVWSIDDRLDHTVGAPGLNGDLIDIIAQVRFTITEMIDA